jgi:hypothetical protein
MKQPSIKSTKLSINLRRFVCLSVCLYLFLSEPSILKPLTQFSLFSSPLSLVSGKRNGPLSLSLYIISLYFSPSLNFVRETEAHLSFVIRISPARVIIWEINAYHFAELRFHNCLPIVLSSKSLQLSSRY